MRPIDDILNLAEDLKEIPHLPIDVEVDLQGLLDELPLSLDYMERWNPDPDSPLTPEIIGQFYKSWELCGVVDFYPNARDGARALRMGKELVEFPKWENGLDKTSVTDLGEKMPKTIEQIYRLGDHPGRCRISRLIAGTELVWHSHYLFDASEREKTLKFKRSVIHYNSPEYVHPIIHIPIITNPDVEFAVKNADEHAWTISRRYSAGEAVLFNSWYEHNVFNRGTTDRFHLMCHMHLADDRFFDLVAKAVGKYKGPRLRNYSFEEQRPGAVK